MTLQEFLEGFRSLGPRAKAKALPALVQELAPSERTPALLTILQDVQSSSLVRTAALKLLKTYCYEDPDLFHGFLSDRNPAVVKASARALKEIEILHKKMSPVSRAFIKKLEATEDKDRRLKILKAVAAVKAPWTQAVLIESLADPSEQIRDVLIKELARREVLNRRLLLQRLACGPWYAKSAAIKIMGLRKNALFIKPRPWRTLMSMSAARRPRPWARSEARTVSACSSSSPTTRIPTSRRRPRSPSAKRAT
jgi:hypothetical protein